MAPSTRLRDFGRDCPRPQSGQQGLPPYNAEIVASEGRPASERCGPTTSKALNPALSSLSISPEEVRRAAVKPNGDGHAGALAAVTVL